MKILIVHHHLDYYGGAELVVAKLAKYLVKQGIETTVMALSRPKPENKDMEEINIITPGKEISYTMVAVGVSDYFRLLQKVVRLRKIVQREMGKYDIINVHNFPAHWTLFPKHKPCVWMCNEPPDLWHNPHPTPAATLGRSAALLIDRNIVKRSVTIGCVADDFNAQRFIDRYRLNPRIVPYGIDYEFFVRGNGTDIARQFNLQNHFTLLQVGQLTPSKNQMASIKVVEQLRQKIKNIRLVLAGLTGSSYERQLRDFIREKDMEKHVIFTGHLPREKVRDLYHGCDVALFPVHSQGSWLSPFEILCAAKPIVVSPEITSSSLIRNKDLGIVTDDIPEAILDIYNNPAKYQAMALRGKEYVQSHLSWDRYCENMLGLFREALTPK